ncbi:MAG: SH3 domain-containing protein [Ramlibacter sp.]
MMRLGKLALLALPAIVGSVLPQAALAQGQPAVTVKPVNLRAGPDPDYPVVVRLPAGIQVGVQGCLEDYSWCDVQAGYSRGWVYAGNLNYYYQNNYVPLQQYGPSIGLSVFPFIIGDYWGRYYRDRSWYGDRNRWIDRHPQHRYEQPRYEQPRYEQPRRDVRPYPQQQPGYVPRPRTEVPAVAPVPGQPQPQRQQQQPQQRSRVDPPTQGGGSGYNPNDPAGNERTRQEQKP